MWRQLSSPREPERIEFPSRPALLLICISVLMVFSCKEEGLKGVFNTWDKLKPRYQWVWGPTILVLSQGATTLTHITSWARTKAVAWGNSSGISPYGIWDIPVVVLFAQGCTWKVTSADPWAERFHVAGFASVWCSLGIPTSWLIRKMTTRLKRLLDAQKGMHPLQGALNGMKLEWPYRCPLLAYANQCRADALTS